MKILVTGSEGFLGSAVCIAVTSDTQQQVICCDRRHQNRDLWKRLGARPSVPEFMKLDITTRQAVKIITAIKPEVVVHLAAIPNDRKCDSDPESCLKTNIIGTYNTLSGALQAGTKLFVMASSQIAYGKPHRHTITEQHPLLPDSLYGLTKLTDERLVEIARENSEMQCIVLRYSSLYGKSAVMNEDNVVSRFARSALKEGVVKVFRPRNLEAPGSQEIDLLHVADAAEATALLVRGFSSIKERIFNVSSGRGTSIMSLALLVARLVRNRTGRTVRIESLNSDQNEPKRRVSSNWRLRKALGWAPRVGLETGISEIVDEMQRGLLA